MRDWEFYFSMILGINLFYIMNSNFDFFENMKLLFEFLVMCEKGKFFCVILLSERAYPKGPTHIF